MPRLYPDTPDFPQDGGAERTVWEALRDQLPDDAVLFAGLRLLDGSDEREIDALVAWPGVGLAALEVKGGHITRDVGSWYQGSGDARHRIDPVGQIQHARHTLTHLLARHGLDVRRARIAHLVVFPHTYVPGDWEIAEAPRGVVVDRGELARLAGKVKRAIDDHGVGTMVPSDDDVDALVQLLAGAFTPHVELLALAAQHEDRLEQMTRDQARVLDGLRSFHRLRIIGGAGSGKTWLALEQARRRTRVGERVALLCYSRGLGRYLERVTSAWPARDRPAYVGLFHDLPLRWGAEPGADDDSDYWERRLPLQLAELAAQRPPADLFDSVVVDEAQDFGELWWPSLVRCLRNRDGGGLFVFMDESQRIFARDGSVPIDLPPYRLDVNLRSTKQIAQLFGAFGQEMVRSRGLSGSAVRVVDVAPDHAVGVADDVVDALLDEGWEPGQIALLTTGPRHPEQRNAVDLGGHSAYWDVFLAGGDVFYGHVLGFKGLERTVVVLAVNGVREAERARQMLYTGMSRARALLVVVGPRAEIERIGGEAARRRLQDAQVWDGVASDS
ncbi:NERD domain-containing protein/DEAD/DEAH box helicase [Cellulomonas fimi]|uniref:ATP-binding domain-containing protein n=1 Tax=Cellulomonas fimi TaxID=1708 RepID=A0A7Y0LXY5_CELFI|nr:NERD domain-containing protein/DEAD/DEAH box helicase [Cellulomonas fimi]NMR20231.1 ATP-binding domain-containing protein [Cellulomonas fimi]